LCVCVCVCVCVCTIILTLSHFITTVGEYYRLWSSPECYFPYTHFTSSSVGPNTFLRTSSRTLVSIIDVCSSLKDETPNFTPYTFQNISHFPPLVILFHWRFSEPIPQSTNWMTGTRFSARAIFPSSPLPDQVWGLPSFLANVYRVFFPRM